MLKNAEDEWMDTHHEIEATILQHFEGIYNNSQNPTMNDSHQVSERMESNPVCPNHENLPSRKTKSSTTD